MARAEAVFARDYAEARAEFLAAAARRVVKVENALHPSHKGAKGEDLAMDSVLLGPADAASLLIVTSGTHGVEGFCGSGCQRALLGDDDLLKRIDAGRVAVLLVHAVNPWGFSFLRRANEDNIDLNRNFADFSRPRPKNAGYEELHELLLPAEWPPTAMNTAAILAARERMGHKEFQAAVSAGQDSRPDGLFHSGVAPSWSNRTLRELLRRHSAGKRRIGWIDIHTGLGPNGHGEKIFAGRNDAADLARTRAWYGADVMSYYDGGSASAEVKGSAALCIHDECPGAQVALMGLEYGTLPFDAVLHALRGAHWLEIHPDAPAALRAQIDGAIRAAFYTETDLWKGMILGQSRTAILQAVMALAET
ncbi:MAG: M14 family metallopeptidase [Betaproteobacteria bacterium]